MQFFSQHGQDQYVYENFFRHKRGGVFVEVGAYDGETMSNTLFFERFLGWSGVCVEPLPSAFAKLSSMRTALCVNAGVSDYEGEGEFADVDMPAHYGKMYSGLVDNYDERHRQFINNYAQGGQRLKVKVRRLGDILDESGIRCIDYMSIDTEGSEIKIIRSLDWTRFDVDVVSIENNYQDQAIVDHMAAVGYDRVHVFQGFDELYRKRG